MDQKQGNSAPHGAELVEEMAKIRIELVGLRRELSELRRDLPGTDTITATELAKKLGVAMSTFYKPWNLPNFGKPDIGNSPRRWFRDKALAWYETPESERRAQWEAMPESERE